MAPSKWLKLELHKLKQGNENVSLYMSKFFSKQNCCYFSMLQVGTVSLHVPPFRYKNVFSDLLFSTFLTDLSLKR